MRNENLPLREDIDRSSMFEEIVGSSPALRCVLAQVGKGGYDRFHGAHPGRDGHRQGVA